MQPSLVATLSLPKHLNMLKKFKVSVYKFQLSFCTCCVRSQLKLWIPVNTEKKMVSVSDCNSIQAVARQAREFCVIYSCRDGGMEAGSKKVWTTGRNLPRQIQILWTILVRNNA